MRELWQLGALELADQIRSGRTTSRAVVEAHLARVDAVNPDLNAVVRRLDDEALAAADAADAAVERGEARGVFHGVPISVKENIDLAGTPTTHGVPLLAEAVAPIDAPVVERMRAAGAIPFVRTNLPDMGLRVHTHSTLHGLTKNPWNPNVTAGGSSGGEASALASGMSPLGLGNDIGGSLRNPAHCCGISSIKPTSGVVPVATVIPPTEQALSAQLMVAEGPMARQVVDVRAALSAVAGWSPRDPRSVSAALTDLGDGEQITIAVCAEPPGGVTHPEIAAAVRRAADVASDAGHNVIEAVPPLYEEVLEYWSLLLVNDLAVGIAELEMVLSSDALGIVNRLIAATAEPTVPGGVALHTARYAAMVEWSRFFQAHPVLLSPTWASPAFEHDADLGDDFARILTDTMRPVLPANLLGLPAAVVPCGTAAGLPVGVQVIGDRFTDLRCLAIAEQIQNAVGAPLPIDPVT